MIIYNCSCEALIDQQKGSQQKKFSKHLNTFFSAQIPDLIAIESLDHLVKKRSFSFKFASKTASKLSIICSFLALFGAVNSSAHAALSAVTVKTIQGRAPLFTGTTSANPAANRLSFEVNGTIYSEFNGNYVAGTTIFPHSSKLSDFKVYGLRLADLTVVADYDDPDGEDAHSTTPFSVGTTTFIWKDSNGTVIAPANYSKTVGCDSELSLPLTLEITTPNVQVHSQYGDPKHSELTTLTKSYLIETKTGFCFLKPNQMNIKPQNTWLNNEGLYGWNTSGSVPSPEQGGGYDTDNFDPINGFNAIQKATSNSFLNPSAKPFPTTGFTNAVFDLIMVGANNSYRYESSDSTAVSVDANGRVTLNSKPAAGEVTITATYPAVGEAKATHQYKFTIEHWLTPHSGVYTLYQATKKCGSLAEIPSQTVLTNSPQTSSDPFRPAWFFINNYYSRAVGSLLGEWGWIDKTTYPENSWGANGSYFWTKEAQSSLKQFVVYSYHGNLDTNDNTDSLLVVCRS